MVLQLKNQIINYQQPLECFFILKLVEQQSRHCSYLLLPLGVPSSSYQIEGTMQVLRPISTFCIEIWFVLIVFYLLYAKQLHSICILCRNLKKVGEITSPLSPGVRKTQRQKNL